MQMGDLFCIGGCYLILELVIVHLASPKNVNCYKYQNICFLSPFLDDLRDTKIHMKANNYHIENRELIE